MLTASFTITSLMKKAFKHYSEKLLRKMKGHLEDLTQHGMDQHLFLEQSLKETYKPYGLILSALKLRSRKASTYLPKTEHKAITITIKI